MSLENDNIISEILNSTLNIINKIELIWDSKDMFINDKDLIIFSYLSGYLSCKNIKTYNKEKILNLILEFSSRNRTDENQISDILVNLCLILSNYIKEDKINYNNSNNNNNLASLNNNNEKNINLNFNEVNNSQIKEIEMKDNTNKENINNKNNNEYYSNNASKISNIIKNSNNIIELDENNEKDNDKDKDEDNSINNKEKNSLNNKNNNNINNQINNINNMNSNSFINHEKDFNNLGKKTIKIENMKKCKICLEEFDENDILNYELECGCIIHYECFDEYVKNSVENNNIPILCPYCKIEIHPNLIYDSLNTNRHINLIEKYEKYSMNNYILNHKDNYSCCPTAGCEYVFYFEEGENRFLCPLCQKEYCLNCKDIWHKQMTCQEYQDTKDVKKCDDKFLKFVRGKNYKICPVCGVWVEKTQGCNNMKCRCGNHFCYKCGKVIPKHIHDCGCWSKK